MVSIRTALDRTVLSFMIEFSTHRAKGSESFIRLNSFLLHFSNIGSATVLSTADITCINICYIVPLAGY